MSDCKTYIGDGVYAAFEEGQLILTTEDGFRATNRIVLEQEVFFALETFVERIRAMRAEACERALR